MPWLEVPDWRSWESYAAPMSDITPEDPTHELDDTVVADSETNAKPEPIVITGTIDIRFEGDDELAPADVTLLDLELAPEFPTTSEPERMPEPVVVEPPAPLNHEPVVLTAEQAERKALKESMSRAQRRAAGW